MKSVVLILAGLVVVVVTTIYVGRILGARENTTLGKNLCEKFIVKNMLVDPASYQFVSVGNLQSHQDGTYSIDFALRANGVPTIQTTVCRFNENRVVAVNQ